MSGPTPTRLMLLAMAAVAVQDFGQPAAAQTQSMPPEDASNLGSLANKTAGATIAQVPTAIVEPTFLPETPQVQAKSEPEVLNPEALNPEVLEPEVLGFEGLTPERLGIEELEPNSRSRPIKVDASELAMEPSATVGNGPNFHRLSLTIAEAKLSAATISGSISEPPPRSAWQIAALAPGEAVDFSDRPESQMPNSQVPESKVSESLADNDPSSALMAVQPALAPQQTENALVNPSLSNQAPSATSAPASNLIAQREIGTAAQPSGNYTRRISQPQRLTAIRVTNRTGRTILIELVGRTGPLTLRPGQTRQLRVNPRDLSLMYWVPRNTVELTAQVSRPQANLLVVGVRESRFPRGNRALYLPDPGGTTVLRVF